MKLKSRHVKDREEEKVEARNKIKRSNVFCREIYKITGYSSTH